MGVIWRVEEAGGASESGSSVAAGKVEEVERLGRAGVEKRTGVT